MNNDALKQKLDAKGRYRLRKNEVVGSIPILVRVEKNSGTEHQDQLEKTGYDYRVIVDNILSGYIADVEHLIMLANLPFVSQIELSAPLYGE